MPLQDALRAELIRPDGPRDLVRAFPSWFGLSLFAGVERPAVVSPPRVPDRGRLGRAARPHHREAPRPHSARQR